MNTEILGVALQIVLLIVISSGKVYCQGLQRRKDMVGFHEAGREIDL